MYKLRLAQEIKNEKEELLRANAQKMENTVKNETNLNFQFITRN